MPDSHDASNALIKYLFDKVEVDLGVPNVYERVKPLADQFVSDVIPPMNLPKGLGDLIGLGADIITAQKRKMLEANKNEIETL